MSIPRRAPLGLDAQGAGPPENESSGGDGCAPAGAAPLTVLYRDERLVAIDKPPGLLTHRSSLDRHARAFALQHLRDQLGRRVWPAHRLDRGTSGVLLFALDAQAARALAAQFEAQTVSKTYLAVVRGHPPEHGRIDHPLRPDADARAGASGAAQAARTDFRRLATVELPVRVDRYPTSRYALLELTPHSGRRHQLRRHLKHIAHPIIGDATHGKGAHNRLFAQRHGCERLLLACVALELAHPDDGAPLALRAPLGGAFARVVCALGWADAAAPWLAAEAARAAPDRAAPLS